MDASRNEATLRSYYAAMDAADFEQALALFTDDACVYRPAAMPTRDGAGGLTCDEGKAGIAEFCRQRGKMDSHHDLQVVVAGGDEVFVEGVVSVGPDFSARFLSHATFASDGRIRRILLLR